MVTEPRPRAKHAPAARGIAQTKPWRGTLSGAFFAVLLAACGGAAEQGSTGNDRAQADADGSGRSEALGSERSGLAPGTSRTDAYRLLTQASFGPTEAEIQHVMEVGVEQWIDEQLSLPVRAAHLKRWNDDAKLNRDGATSNSVVSSFYQEALQDDDQLRQRVTFALSEIFVVSMVDLGLAGAKSQAAASYLDMLAQHAFGNYRDLIGAVATHPAMGVYLSAMANRKENADVGRIPDQNFAREVMQLFSIGLVELNPDGTPKPGPVYTYGPADIDGLSHVFTGFSWAGPDQSKERFFNNADVQAPYRLYTPMQPYPQYHSTAEKDFLGVVIPQQQVPHPRHSINVALDTLAAHPNVGPFLSKQLIQRLVTSNPSAKYVARVAAVFKNDGHGQRGNLGAVVKAILMDKEARLGWDRDGHRYGKVREPVLRLTAFLRAYEARSQSGRFLINSTDDPGTELSQSPLRARSVFNFYRPGYVPPGGQAEQSNMTLPEMQITNENSVAGYANYMMGAVRLGVGQKSDDKDAVNDVQPDYRAAMKLADDPAALVDDTIARLLLHTNDELRQMIISAVTSIEVPDKREGNGDYVKKQKQNRVWAAVLLVLASPEFVVQK
jgi:uncharacterized protein (DUF1800 family)